MEANYLFGVLERANDLGSIEKLVDEIDQRAKNASGLVSREGGGDVAGFARTWTDLMPLNYGMKLLTKMYDH